LDSQHYKCGLSRTEQIVNSQRSRLAPIRKRPAKQPKRYQNRSLPLSHELAEQFRESRIEFPQSTNSSQSPKTGRNNSTITPTPAANPKTAATVAQKIFKTFASSIEKIANWLGWIGSVVHAVHTILYLQFALLLLSSFEPHYWPEKNFEEVFGKRFDNQRAKPTIVYIETEHVLRALTLAKEKLLTRREAVILSILIDGEKYGREIRNQYEERARRKMPLGSLYTTLSRMETHGFIESRTGESTHGRGGNRRKYFRITASGHRAFSDLEIFFGNVMGRRLGDA
jgi:PadR family transcriptional regulator